MKIQNKILIALIVAFGLVSCDKFLDEMPDKRTEVDSKEKVSQILVSAYPQSMPILLLEYMSDNMTDQGPRYNVYYDITEECYLFKDVTATHSSSPSRVWEDCYKAAAAANLALEAIEELGNPSELDPQRGEALLCRAYAHFVLGYTFCQMYNPSRSNTDLGVPYAMETEKVAVVEYERGTVAQLYKKINDDIEEALPLLRDDAYSQPKYHFNKRAAYSFASFFNLCYRNYQKVIDYANLAIDEDPSANLRNIAVFRTLNGRDENTHEWINSQRAANLLIQPVFSYFGRCYAVITAYNRHAVSGLLSKNETFQSAGPWGDEMYHHTRLFGSTNVTFAKLEEFFVFSDVAAGIGSARVVYVPFTVDKTLLYRAEAYAMLNDFEKATRDLNYIYVAGGGSASTEAGINSFYAKADAGKRKPLNPGFAFDSEKQENFIHAVLHARRIVTMHEGVRTIDLKRLGIEYTHEVVNGTDIKIQPFDNRLAIQIPDLVVSAGMQKNPR